MSQLVSTNSLKAWILASRPKTLGAITCPILIGNALAYNHGDFSWRNFFIILVDGILLQILANVVNDYGDFIKGSDKADRLGPPRAMQMGWITKNAMIFGIGVLLVVSSLLGLVLVYFGGPFILVTGACAIVLCLTYTLGPKPIAYVGFAEIIIFFIFGPMTVLGSYFVQTHTWSLEALVMSMSSGNLSAALLLTNNLRDVVQDRRNNKRTIAVRFGDKIARKLIMAFVFAAMLSPVVLVVSFSFSPLLLFSLAALVIPIRQFPIIATEAVSARFNIMLAAIGKSLYLFGVLFWLGAVYGAL